MSVPCWECADQNSVSGMEENIGEINVENNFGK